MVYFEFVDGKRTRKSPPNPFQNNSNIVLRFVNPTKRGNK